MGLISLGNVIGVLVNLLGSRFKNLTPAQLDFARSALTRLGGLIPQEKLDALEKKATDAIEEAGKAVLHAIVHHLLENGATIDQVRSALNEALPEEAMPWLPDPVAQHSPEEDGYKADAP